MQTKLLDVMSVLLYYLSVFLMNQTNILVLLHVQPVFFLICRVGFYMLHAASCCQVSSVKTLKGRVLYGGL